MDVAKGCGDGEETIGNFAQGVVDLENLLGQVTCGGDMYSTRNTGDERDEHSFFSPISLELILECSGVWVFEYRRYMPLRPD